MKRQRLLTLRVGLAFMLALFANSALPNAAVYALESGATESTAPETVTPSEPTSPTTETQPSDAQPTPVTPPTDPLPPTPEAPAPELVPESTPAVLPDDPAPVTPETSPAAATEEQLTQDTTSTQEQPADRIQVLDSVAPYPVTICHRTASYTNPYVKITVSSSAVDGVAGNSGNEADHYGEHKGPLFSASLPKHTEWGDIIPAVPPFHTGQNLGGGGQEILNNDCNVQPSMSAEAGPCVESDATNGMISVMVAGSANGAKVKILSGDEVVVSWNLTDSTTMPLVADSLAAGTYTVELSKGNTVYVSTEVIIEECETPPTEIAIPAQPSPYDPCGPRNADWLLPTDTDQLNWELDSAHNLIVYTTEGYVFTDGTTMHNYGQPVDSNEPCATTCPVNSMVYVTMWLTDGETMPAAGAWPSGTPGTYKFTVQGLELATPEVQSYVYGLINGGYTKLVDIDAMRYSTYRFSDSTGNNQVVPSYVLYVDYDGNIATTGDQEYLIFEPIYNGTVVENSWQTWDVLGGGTSTWWSDSSGGDPTLVWNAILAAHPNAQALYFGFNQGTYNPGAHTMVQDIVFDCATIRFSVATTPPSGGGQVLGTSTATPTAAPVAAPQPTGHVLPAALPATGGETNYLLLGVVLSAATYFVALRRQQA